MAHIMSLLLSWFSLRALFVLFMCPLIAEAQPDVFISVGGKIGYSFGSSGGTIGGVEVSVTRWPDNKGMASGLCVSWERTESITLVHVGLELIQGYAGGSLGPSIVYRNDTPEMGVAGTLWGGLLLLPYLRTTWLPSSERSIPESGVFLKFPHRLTRGTTFRIGG